MVIGVVSWLSLALTLFIATVLEIIAIPDILLPLRPAWLALCVVYWLIRHPEKVGVYFALSVGVLMDVITGGYFGIHMLSLSILAYFVLLMHQRINMFPMLQQAIVVFILVSIYLMIVYLLRSHLSGLDSGMDYLWRALATALFWPLVVILTDRLSFALR